MIIFLFPREKHKLWIFYKTPKIHENFKFYLGKYSIGSLKLLNSKPFCDPDHLVVYSHQLVSVYPDSGRLAGSLFSDRC